MIQLQKQFEEKTGVKIQVENPTGDPLEKFEPDADRSELPGYRPDGSWK